MPFKEEGMLELIPSAGSYFLSVLGAGAGAAGAVAGASAAGAAGASTAFGASFFWQPMSAARAMDRIKIFFIVKISKE